MTGTREKDEPDAWTALAATPDDADAKARAAASLRRDGAAVPRRHAALLHRLLLDAAFDPVVVARAGWRLIAADPGLPPAAHAGADAVEADDLALALLAETPVTVPAAERALTALRRWLLLAGADGDHPRLAAALRAQASRNGGAWPFAADERAVIDRDPDHPLRPAYLPHRRLAARPDYADPVTAAVADQYRDWPYPTWERLPAPSADTIGRILSGYGEPVRAAIEGARDILVAGCGTGEEALHFARIASHAHITAIDISAASLAYAAERCADVPNITFRRLDLHAVRDLGRRFPVVVASGVLHHLPDPEAGWRALIDVLEPGGVIGVQLYSRLGRLPVAAARRIAADLIERRPVDDDLIRAVRARLLAASVNHLASSPDFYSLAGVRDLLLHTHEDAFDLARIRRFVEQTRLTLLGFVLDPVARTAYRRHHPGDPDLRDYAALQRAELADPGLFAGSMYDLWCRAPMEAVAD